MSVLGKLFGAGGGKGSKGGPTPQEAIQRLRDTEEMLSKKQEFLEKKIEQELTAAKKHGTKNKRAALQALKRKKRYEKQLAQIDGTLSTIEFQREALENANTNTEVLKNMSFAAKAMKTAHDNMDIDKVDELMQDIADQQELAEEISTAISKPVGFGEEFDEDELLVELEKLEQEELDKNLLEISGPETVPLPNVPSVALPSKPDFLGVAGTQRCHVDHQGSQLLRGASDVRAAALPAACRIWYSIAWLIIKLRVTSSLEEKCKTRVRKMSFPPGSRPHLAVGSLRPSPATSKRLSSALKNHVLHSVPCVLHHHVKFSINSSE